MPGRAWFQVQLCLIIERFQARRDPKVRFLQAQVRMLRRRLPQKTLIPKIEERAELTKIGAELDHEVAELLDVVTRKTYRQWLRDASVGKEH